MLKTIKSLKKIRLPLKNPKGVPENPGVYIFWSKNTPIYIGKAKNLKNRVASYFSLSLGKKTRRMISDANALSIVNVNSELESLLLEAHLIRICQPKYNFASKDDKHPLYIVITREEYPRVLS